MSERVTSTRVARFAEISQAAASRAYTPGVSVSPKTADKLRHSAATLGARSDVLAGAIMSGRSRIIGVVVAYLENVFYPEALERLSNALQAEGYHGLVSVASQTAGDLEEAVEEILDLQVEGIIAASVATSSTLAQRFRDAVVPIVFFNRIQEGEHTPSVTSDNFAGGQTDAELLLAAGHKKIGSYDVPPAAWGAYDLTAVRQRATITVEKAVDVTRAHRRPKQARKRTCRRSPPDLPKLGARAGRMGQMCLSMATNGPTRRNPT